MSIGPRNTFFEKVPLTNLAAPKVLSRRNRTENTPSADSIARTTKDADMILGFAGLDRNPHRDIMSAEEKYMIETQPNTGEAQSARIRDMSTRQKGVQRPHYTRLFVYDNTLVFQTACCLPLKIVAASLDGNPVCGRILYNTYSEEGGGKLVYEFQGKGTEMIIDLIRGESTRAQRHIFRGMRQ